MSRIRNATLYDLDALTPMIEGFKKEAEMYTPYVDVEYVKTLLIELIKSSILVVAEDEETEELLGVIGGAVVPFPFNPNIKVASELFWWVSPETRDRHLGIDLLQAFEERAQKLECSVIAMSILKSTPKAVEATLEKFDYTQYEKSYIKGI